MTAGNASTLNDGAACLVLASERVAARARRRAARPRRLGRRRRASTPPSWASARSSAVPKALDAAGLTMDDIDLVELNEAFAAQSIACARELGIDDEQAQRQRRRDRARPSARLLGRAADDDAACGSCAGAAAATASRPSASASARASRRWSRTRPRRRSPRVARHGRARAGERRRGDLPHRRGHGPAARRRPLPRRRRLRGDPPLRRPARSRSRDHLDRIERSAAAIELPVDRAALEREVAALLEAFGDADGALRIVLTRGGRRIAVTEPLPDWPQTVSVATVTYAPSVILTGVKSISYAANMQATRIAAARGADEAILVRPDGIVLEAPTSSIFWVSAEGDLRTPSISSGILESITRARGSPASCTSRRASGSVDDLRGAGEAFLASTTREVQAISAIDGRDCSTPARPAHRGGDRGLRRVVARGPSSTARLGFRAMDFQLHRRAAPDLGDGARLRRQRDHPAGARERPRTRASTASWRACSARWATSGAPVAEEYGGRGLDYVTYGLIVEEVGRGDSSARTVVSVQTSLVCGSIERWGTEEQKQAWLPRLCSGEALGCFAPDRARHRLRRRHRCARGRRRPTAAGRSRARRCGSRWATSPRSRWSSPRPTPRRGTRASPASSSRPSSDGYAAAGDPRQARAARLRHRRDLARRRRGRRRRDAGRDRRRLQGRDERARLGPLQRRRRLRGDLRGLRRGVGRPTRPSASSSACRSPASSSSRR